ncbi:MAG: 23S rRNA (guanosine2251-2'-O)-methyltransferase, partial [Patiriisocius sp.]
MDDRYLFIYGKHAVIEALTFRPDVITSLSIRGDVKHEIDRELLSRVAIVNTFKGDDVPKEVDRKATHQGMIAKIDRQKLVLTYEQFRETLEVTNDTCLAILGEVQDPHNVGAVVRSAAAFGVSAVLIPKHRQAGVTGTVVKVSAGMAFKLPLVEIGNVNRAIEDMKKEGFFIYGLDGGGDTQMHTEDFSKPTVFVLGNEGEGMREKTKEHCDMIVSIPMHDRCESLNASAS